MSNTASGVGKTVLTVNLLIAFTIPAYAKNGAASGFTERKFWLSAFRYTEGVSINSSSLLPRIPVVEVFPVVENATMNAKATAGEAFPVQATVFREGHDLFAAEAVLITPQGTEHSRTIMYEVGIGLDRMEAWVQADVPGDWTFRIESWSDPWATWKHNAALKLAVNQDEELVCLEGAKLLQRAAAGKALETSTPPSKPRVSRKRPARKAAARLLEMAALLEDTQFDPEYRVNAATSPDIEAIMRLTPLRDFLQATPKYPLVVDRPAALYGSWYEIFPRSAGAHQDSNGNWVSGTLRSAETELERIASQGFTVAYLTPIHPIGETKRKGPNNSLSAAKGDPGSPYGIGSSHGGHDAIHPNLGSFADFDHFVEKANSLGLEVALDLALQCSPDHPWVKDHPDWFVARADGSIAYAENPPKKYQDIYPLSFDKDPEGLYQEIYRVVELWISHGVKIFRVDNPHTKPVAFWQRFLGQMHQEHPEVLFLAEAFTRPAMMRTLGMVGFQQSYTYFAWRTSKTELEEYLTEVSSLTAHLMRPAFWPTTHDILTEQMTTGGPAIFAIRAVLAALGSPTWGIYSGYEMVENIQRPGSEEQIDNEKYQYRPRDWHQARDLGIESLLRKLNEVRASHPALRQLHQLSIHPTSSDQLLCFSKHVPAKFSPTGHDDTVLVVVNLNPHECAEGAVYLDYARLFPKQSRNNPPHPAGKISVFDELTGHTFEWGEGDNFVRLCPAQQVAHVFSITTPQNSAPESDRT